MKLVDVPVVFTGPALERNIDRASGLSTVLGIVGITHDAEFSDRISRRYISHTITGLIGHAVEQKFIGVSIAPSIDTDVRSSVVRPHQGDVLILVDCLNARRESSKEIADPGLAGQLCNCFRLDDGS